MENSYNMRLITALVFCISAAIAAPSDNIAPRLIGGTPVAISRWPQMANVLFTWDLTTFEHYCAGTILNHQTVLTAAHCISFHPYSRFRLRIASALASSGGSAVNVVELIPHPFYNPQTEDFDFGLIRTATYMNYTTQIQSAPIANSDYTLEDNEIVKAIGWGASTFSGPRSEQLREVQLSIINQEVCEKHYSTENVVITNNMLCAGSLEVAGRGQCEGDAGGGLFHNGVLVGVYSFGINCGVRYFPSVNARVSRVSEWIEANM